MAYGLQITNPSGELVIDSEGFGLFCIGKMTLQGSVVQTSGTIGFSPGRVGGYSRYRITSTVKPTIAFDLPLNKKVGIRSLTNLGSNVWEVEMHCGDTADANGFDTVEYQVDVWAFAPPGSSPVGAYGLALYNSSGVLTYDSTAGVPMTPMAFVDGVGTSYTIPSLTRPVFMGWTPTNVIAESYRGSNTWWDTTSRGRWTRSSATALGKGVYVDQIYSVSSPPGTPPGNDGGDTYNQPGLILEGSYLP